MLRNAQCAVIFDCCGDNQWMLGIYDSPAEALGAIMKNILKQIDQIESNIRYDEECHVEIKRREDNFSNAYIEITAIYAKTSFNDELTGTYRVYYVPPEEN